MADSKTVAELTSDDGPKLIALVVGKALGIPGDMPKDILAAARAQLPEVDTGDKAPKPALLQIAKFLAERGPEPEPEVILSDELPALPWDSESLGGASKGQIVEFLVASCGTEFLQRHKLNGAVKAVTKKAKLPELHAAYTEVAENAQGLLVSPAAKAVEAQAARLASLEKEREKAAAAAGAEAAAAEAAAAAAAKAAEPKGYKKKVTKKGNKTHFPKVGDNV
jgi:hypothetical protein